MDYRVAQHEKYKESGGMGSWDSGVLTIGLSEWREYHNEIAILCDLGDFIWRGQRLKWPLKSKFDRVVTSGRKAKLKKHFEAFIRAIKGRRGTNPPNLRKDKEEAWSLGQHYGLITPLLDWTESPFVAAYFAFESDIVQKLLNALYTPSRLGVPKENKELLENAPSRFIYGLCKDIVRWGPATPKRSEPLDYFIKWVESSSDENPRLLNQRGLFTMPMSEKIDIEKTVQSCYAADKKKKQKRIIFVKIKIPEIERETCLCDLNRMNINHATLFPDLMGASKYCNMKLEIANYS